MLNVSISGSEKDLSLVYSYDCKTDTWTLVAPISSPRDAVGVCVLGDRLYAVGGYDGQQYLNDVESYDAQNNEWTEVSVVFFFLQRVLSNSGSEHVHVLTSYSIHYI